MELLRKCGAHLSNDELQDTGTELCRSLSLSHTQIFFFWEFCSKPDKKSHGISDLQLHQLVSLHRLWEKSVETNVTLTKLLVNY